METKQVMRDAVRLAYTPPIAAKSKAATLGYMLSWRFDATVVGLLVAFATLYVAA